MSSWSGTWRAFIRSLYLSAAPSSATASKPIDEQPSDVVTDDLDRKIVVEPGVLNMPEGETLARHTRLVFACWVIVFAVVGAQMGWVLRPFIGSPTQHFEWFRARESNFFEAVAHAMNALFGGG